jgi:hypothetical protein
MHEPQTALFSSKPFQPLQRPVTAEDLSHLASGLETAGSNGYMKTWILCPEPPHSDCTHTSQLLDNFSMKAKCSQVPVDLDDVIQRSALSLKEIELIEFRTRGQNSNPDWHEIRLYRLTASNFGAVIKGISRGTYPPSLLQRLATGNAHYMY